MSYPLDLEEISETRLLEELAERAKRRAAGLCDYCRRPAGAEPPCKMTRRHEGRSS